MDPDILKWTRQMRRDFFVLGVRPNRVYVGKAWYARLEAFLKADPPLGGLWEIDGKIYFQRCLLTAVPF